MDVSQSSDELLRLKREVAAGVASGGEKPKSEVTVLLEGGGEYSRVGSLEFSDVTVNQTTGTVTLRAIVGNPNQELLPACSFVRASPRASNRKPFSSRGKRQPQQQRPGNGDGGQQPIGR